MHCQAGNDELAIGVFLFTDVHDKNVSSNAETVQRRHICSVQVVSYC